MKRAAAIFLMGPTASGKTDLAAEIATQGPFRVVSVDSALVYRGMDIGTAKPDASILARTPHALIDIRDPEQAYSAAEFRADALRAMAEIAADGNVPLLVGGTGLYFSALERGLSELPWADPRMRLAIAQEAAMRGWREMHRELAALDPIAAARIHPNDPQRIQRALEVIRLTGKPLSSMQGARGQRLPYRLLKIALAPPREALHRRIALRFRHMLESGLLDETRRLKQRAALTENHPAMRAVGYRQAWHFLEGRITEAELPAQGIYATRQLAKRQTTWLRREFDAISIDPETPGARAKIRQLLAEFIG